MIVLCVICIICKKTLNTLINDILGGSLVCISLCVPKSVGICAIVSSANETDASPITDIILFVINL